MGIPVSSLNQCISTSLWPRSGLGKVPCSSGCPKLRRKAQKKHLGSILQGSPCQLPASEVLWAPVHGMCCLWHVGQLGTAAPAAPEGCGMVTWGWSTHFSSQQWQLLFLTHCFGYLTGVSEFNINRRAFWSSDIFNFCLVSELLPYFTASSSFDYLLAPSVPVLSVLQHCVPFLLNQYQMPQDIYMCTAPVAFKQLLMQLREILVVN